MKHLVAFFKQVMEVKRTKRTGWVVQGVKESESVADHIFGTAFICMVLAPKYGLDQAKLVKMALVHDIAEGLTGDIVLEKGTMPVTPKELKHEKEELALKQFFKDLPEEHEYHELQKEFERLESKEARFLKQIDKLEMIIQALHYEETDPHADLDELWINVERYIKDKELIDIFNELKKLRRS